MLAISSFLLLIFPCMSGVIAVGLYRRFCGVHHRPDWVRVGLCVLIGFCFSGCALMGINRLLNEFSVEAAPGIFIDEACDPAYPDFCLPAGPPDLNCSDIPMVNFRVKWPDPHGFDADHDGIGCER
jgi:hypothetical protein